MTNFVHELAALANRNHYYQGRFDQKKGKWYYPKIDEPLTDEVLAGHLRSDPPIAVAVNIDRKTNFAVFDIDAKHGEGVEIATLYRDQIGQYLEERNVPFFVCRSGGGHGFHVWIVFDRAITVSAARNAMLDVLKNASGEEIAEGTGGAINRQIELRPMSDKGDGGAIALPLARESRLLARRENEAVWDCEVDTVEIVRHSVPRGGTGHLKATRVQVEDQLEEAFEYASRAFSADAYSTGAKRGWIECGMLLKAAAPDRFDLWHEWSKQGSGYGSEADCRKKWDSFTPTRYSQWSLFRIAKEQGWPGTSPCGIITNGRGTAEITREAWSAIVEFNGDDPTIFRMGTVLARITDDGQGNPLVQALTKDGTAHVLERVAPWMKMQRNGPVPCPVPTIIVQDLLHTPPSEMPVPPLRGVSRVPVFCPDGSLHSESGYSPKSQLYHIRELDVDLPETITKADVDEAVALFRDDLLVDFPFEDEASFAHCMSWALMPFARAFIGAPMPLHLVNKSVKGAGGGLLTTVLSLPYLGHAPEIVQMTGEEELRKRITAKFRAGCDYINFDNVEYLQSSILAAALTATHWSDRILGYSEEVQFPNDKIWCGSGNNIGMSGEIARRTLPILIVPDDEEPHLRTEFKHPHLVAWAEANRARLVRALLIIVGYWVQQGMPESKVRIGSYERFCAVMGGILELAGIEGLTANQSSGSGETQAERARRKFLGHWLHHNLTNPDKAVWEANAGWFPVEWLQHAEFEFRIDFDQKGKTLAALGREMAKANKRVFKFETRDGDMWKVKFLHMPNSRKPFAMQVINREQPQGGDCDEWPF